MSATIHPIEFQGARECGARRRADQLLAEARLTDLRTQARQRQAAREGFAVGLQYGMRTSGGLAFALGAIATAALVALL